VEKSKNKFLDFFVRNKVYIDLKTKGVCVVDEHSLKEFSSKICSYETPDVYKKKGILYKNQSVILKKGKKKTRHEKK